MIKEFIDGNFYYVKIDVPTFLSITTDALRLLLKNHNNSVFKYRCDGGSWVSGTATATILRLNRSGLYSYLQILDSSYNELSYVYLYSITTLEMWGYFDNDANNLLSYTIENGRAQYVCRNTRVAPMMVELDKLNCEPHVVNKLSGTNLLFVDNAFGTPREEFNILTPSITFEYDKLPDFNYVHIPSLQRYYFVTNIVCVRNNVYRIDLKVDVLTSFATDIANQDAFISRNENSYNTTLVDSRYPLSDVPHISYIANIGDISATKLNNVVWDYDSVTMNNNIALSVINDVTISGTQDAVKPTGTTLPTIKRRTGDNPLTIPYAINYTKWGYVTSQIKSQSSLAGYVSGAVYFPFKLEPDIVVDANNDPLEWQLKINNVRIHDNNNVDQNAYVLKGESSMYYIFADFTIQSDYTDNLVFLNYEPYSQYQLYIPFKGWVDLSAREIVDKRVICYYAVDYETGDGSVFVYNYTDNKMLYSSPVQIGIKMGASVSNIEEITKQKQTNTANLLLGLIGSATSVVIGAVTENPLAIVSGVLTGTKAIANAVNVNRMLIEKSDCTISGDKIGLYGGYKPVLKEIRYINLNIDTSVYPKIQGFPLNQYDNLSGYTGYTEIPELHYTPSSQLYITKTEIDEIVSLAKNGIIL